MISSSDITIAVVGLGYVGLPLAVEFGKKYVTIGYDICKPRITELINNVDRTLEVAESEIASASKLSFANDLQNISKADVYIVTVPTPIDAKNNPDLRLLVDATKDISRVLSPGNYVIYESTVYPGATEEICVPILEKYSKLSYFDKSLEKSNPNAINIFHLGYSPERINPGDKEHRLVNIKKVTSGSSDIALRFVDDLYNSIIDAGTFPASSIAIAEAAKVIENTQRDVNIALINELAMFFSKIDIDIEEVLSAARTKWNFLDFRPGLVGGHCIGVDPYYLTYKAKKEGFNPKTILAGREINDSVSAYIANQVTVLFSKKSIDISNSNILVMGITFKEDCPDTRNSKVFDVIKILESFGVNISIYDPLADINSLSQDISKKFIPSINVPNLSLDGVIFAVAHSIFKKINISQIKKLCNKNHVLYDVKHIYSPEEVDGRL